MAKKQLNVKIFGQKECLENAGFNLSNLIKTQNV